MMRLGLVRTVPVTSCVYKENSLKCLPRSLKELIVKVRIEKSTQSVLLRQRMIHFDASIFVSSSCPQTQTIPSLFILWSEVDAPTRPSMTHVIYIQSHPLCTAVCTEICDKISDSLTVS